VHVSNLRAKLRRSGAEPVQTVWGVGYKWQV
jgi:DNA-binding response OmpR family regulator